MNLIKTSQAVAVFLPLGINGVQAQPRFPDAANVPGVSAALAASPPYDCVTNRYVDAARGADTNPGTRAKPWQTIQNADDGYPNKPVAGECVNVLPGLYKLNKTLILGNGGNRNTRTGYVVYRSTVPQGAHLLAETEPATHGIGDVIMLYGSYLIVDGFDVDGNKSSTAGHGIDGCAGGGRQQAIAHHFMAINNIVHDMGGAGLTSCTADHIIWRNNVVYNTSFTSTYQASGIGLWQPQALAAGSFTPTAADHETFGIVIAYNIAHDNREGPAITWEHTDGNGIIIDTTLNSSKCPTCGTPYPGKVLVLGNVSYANGGGGIHVFQSKNVTIANNTVYNNYLDTANHSWPRGELSNVGSFQTNWINNIAIARPGHGILARNEPITTLPLPGGFRDDATWTHNVAFGNDVTSDAASYVDPATNLIGVDPKLDNPNAAAFGPKAGSPVVKRGMPADFVASPTPDIGAY